MIPKKEGFNPFLVPLVDDVPDFCAFPLVGRSQAHGETVFPGEGPLKDLKTLVEGRNFLKRLMLGDRASQYPMSYLVRNLLVEACIIN